MEEYNVVFRYTNKDSKFNRKITQRSFNGKDEFIEWYTPNMKKLYDVIDRGITKEGAIEYVRKANDISSRVAKPTRSGGMTRLLF